MARSRSPRKDDGRRSIAGCHDRSRGSRNGNRGGREDAPSSAGQLASSTHLVRLRHLQQQSRRRRSVIEPDHPCRLKRSSESRRTKRSHAKAARDQRQPAPQHERAQIRLQALRRVARGRLPLRDVAATRVVPGNAPAATGGAVTAQFVRRSPPAPSPGRTTPRRRPRGRVTAATSRAGGSDGRTRSDRPPLPFNQGVAGSIPARPTNEIGLFIHVTLRRCARQGQDRVKPPPEFSASRPTRHVHLPLIGLS